MKKRGLYKKMLLVLFIVIALGSYAQKQFTITSSRANNTCNGDCTMLDEPDLNNNPAAVIWITPILDNGLNLNPHPIGVYYSQEKWRIQNLDQTSIPTGAKFSVEYVTRPDQNHFQYVLTLENIQKDGAAFIDHPALNNHPEAKFRLVPSWGSQSGQAVNRDEIYMQYNTDAGKWSINNINKKFLYQRVTYNIIVSKAGNTALTTGDPVVKKGSKIILQPADTDSILTKSLDKNSIAKKSIPKSYDFSNVHICIDKVTSKILPPKTPVTNGQVVPKIKSNGELEQVSTITQPLTGVTNLMWSPGESITIGFFSDVSTFFKDKVKKYVKEWETYANIKFVFINEIYNDLSKAQIKVGFENDGTSWSWVGRDVLINTSDEKTMNFGWFTTTTAETEFRRTILHELGHALGFIHEHQAPLAGIAWDSAKVYSFFGNAPNNWSREKINFNVFAKYTQESTNSSAYDRLSIMHYFFPPELTTDGSSFTSNTNLSVVDKEFARQVYPFPPAPPTSAGVLSTGDDCDEIEFTVEYNVVHQSEVEFILQPGYDHHNALVNWWKMIGITQTTGIVAALELNKTIKIPVNMINKNKPITFGKAKILGVHTGLGFTWNPWPAIIGGCRVKFVWRRDSCN